MYNSGRVGLGYSGIGKSFVCQTNEFSWYSECSDALAVCCRKNSADFFVA